MLLLGEMQNVEMVLRCGVLHMSCRLFWQALEIARSVTMLPVLASIVIRGSESHGAHDRI
jgi:hypothetical protein